MAFRKKSLKNGTEVLLGRDAESNDELMKEFKGKVNTILHTRAPGSPFGVILKDKPTKEDIYQAGSVVAGYSQDWRDHKRDIVIDVFTGKSVSKRFWMKKGTWNVKNAKTIKIKKEDIEKD
ncbi:MAG: NFACT RNA binding domain-containing protein [Nanoarchaeota archaeon]|nr:NFACT RNA binding domain-containing protein [Nanoarchaeota archaeon]